MQRSKTKKSKCRKERTVIFPPMSKLPFHYGLQLRIYPSCEQMRIIHRNIDAGRWYYNQLVAWGRLRLPKTEGNFPVFDAMRQRCDELMNPRLGEWKETHPWLNNDDLDSLTFDNAKKSYQAAWNLCKKVKSAGRPNFHKAATHQSYQTSCHYNGKAILAAGGKPDLTNGSVRLVGKDKIVLPKLGSIRYKGSPKLVEKVRRMGMVRIGTVTIRILPTGEVWASLQLASDEPFAKPMPKTGKNVGIDLNLSNFLTDSDGNVIRNPRHYRRMMAHLKKFQRRQGKRLSRAKERMGMKPTDHMSRKQLRELGNYQKASLDVRKAQQKVRRQRKDFLDKLSFQYIKNHDTVAAEELRSRNLMKNHALSMSIADAGWRTLLDMLGRKAQMYGRTFVTVNPKNTTQTCSACGHIMKGEDKIKLGVEEWTCPVCGTHHSRDWNAAKNILARGLEKLGSAPPVLLWAPVLVEG